jgi:Flp pilus assembly protein TadG
MRRFWSNEKGSMIVMFAVALIPVLALMGAAIDYSRASLARTKMQGALDATALFLSRLPANTSQDELNTKGTQFFYANYTESDVLDIQLTITPAVTPGKLNLTANGTYNPIMVNVAGVTSFPVGTTTEVKWGNSRLRVSLVLDVTGSMSSDGKMDALKPATKNLLTMLKNAAITSGDVYVSIIPFNKDVAVDPVNWNSDWVKFDWLEPNGTKALNSWDALRGTCACAGTTVCTTQFTNRNSCEGAHLYRCSKPQYTGQTSCQNNGGTWSSTPIYSFTGVWTPADHATWNGCIMDRDKDPVGTADFDTKNTAPTSLDPRTQFPAEQFASCPARMMSLSYDWIALNLKVDELAPVGNTNQGIGIQWGWQSLTSAPFTIPAFDPNYVHKHVIILMSDGVNTQNRWSSSASAIDAREAITCVNAKAANIIIYTVQVNTGGDPLSTVLRDCATDLTKFFQLTSASQIITTFDQIGTELSNLHLSQ